MLFTAVELLTDVDAGNVVDVAKCLYDGQGGGQLLETFRLQLTAVVSGVSRKQAYQHKHLNIKQYRLTTKNTML